MKRYFSLPKGVQLGFLLGFLLLAGPAIAQDTSPGEAEPLSRAELDQMLAPVALYPDTVLSHLLIAATYPLEVIMAERWVRENPDLEGSEAVEAVENQDWDPSVKALVAFPDLLKRMSEDLDWTENLGEAFLADESRVLDSIQTLRQKAYDAGSLEDLEHLAVSREEKEIIIEPVVREVVYVPRYDTRVVYGSWWWADHPPHHWYHDHHHHSHALHWGPRVHLSSHFFFSAFHWDNRHIVVIDRGYRAHKRVYRARHIARHRHASHWQHNPYHRRGVKYRNPRTRAYIQRRAGEERAGVKHYRRNNTVERTQQQRQQRNVELRQRLGEKRLGEKSRRVRSESDVRSGAEERRRAIRSELEKNRRKVERAEQRSRSEGIKQRSQSTTRPSTKNRAIHNRGAGDGARALRERAARRAQDAASKSRAQRASPSARQQRSSSSVRSGSSARSGAANRSGVKSRRRNSSGR